MRYYEYRLASRNEMLPHNANRYYGLLERGNTQPEAQSTLKNTFWMLASTAFLIVIMLVVVGVMDTKPTSSIFVPPKNHDTRWFTFHQNVMGLKSQTLAVIPSQICKVVRTLPCNHA